MPPFFYIVFIDQLMLILRQKKKCTYLKCRELKAEFDLLYLNFFLKMRDAARWYQSACADFYLEFADKTRSVPIEIIWR